MRVLMITSEWPTTDMPQIAPFVVRQVRSLQQAGIEVDVFHFRGARRIGNYLRAWKNVHRKLSTQHYDLVHAQWGQSALPALPKQIPLVVTFRGSDLEGLVGEDGQYSLQGKLLSLLSRTVALVADEVILVSTRLSNKIPKRTVHIIPSGLDLDLFKPMNKAEARQQLGLPKNKKLILFGGDPSSKVKRLWLAESAVTLVQKTLPEAQMIKIQGLAPDRIPLFINACDILLLTSSHEGSPNTIKEALACNVPVVSTDVGDVQERIGYLEGCKVCPDDNPETIANELLSVLSLNKRINGRSTVEGLDEKKLTEEVIRVYKKALGKNV